VTGVLYEAAREKAGAPLCHLAANALGKIDHRFGKGVFPKVVYG